VLSFSDPTAQEKIDLGEGATPPARSNPTLILWQAHGASPGGPGGRRPSRNRRPWRAWRGMPESRRKWSPPRLRSQRRTGAPPVAPQSALWSVPLYTFIRFHLIRFHLLDLHVRSNPATLFLTNSLGRAAGVLGQVPQAYWPRPSPSPLRFAPEFDASSRFCRRPP